LLFNHELLVKLMTNVEQRALRFVDYAITVTPQLRDLYVERGANPERLAVVLNATDPPWGSPSNDVPTDGAFVLFTHGTVEERYGHDTVVRAVALAAPRAPGLQFWFTGDGRYVAPVLDLARRLGVADRVHYRGFLPLGEVGALLHAAGATVVAQKASSYSHLVHTCKLFEYVQASKPVIASRLRATEACFGPDAVRYFEPGDPGSLAEAIVETYRNERLRASLVEGAQMLHAKYGWHRHRRTYVDLVDRLVAE
jgi:glycosyltransferase involved in cell wall biosynthesis